MDCSLLGSPVHGILQRILEWAAISFSRGSSWPGDQTWVSCIGRQILYQLSTRETLKGPHAMVQWDLFQECSASWSTLVPSLRSSGPTPCPSPLKNTQQKGQLRTDILWFSYLYHLIWETPAIPRAFRPISNMPFLLDHNNPSLLFVFQRPWENVFDSLKFHRESYFILLLIGG